jgi:hypothetical protein
MMTDRLEVSVLAAPLCAIDRRALSQAWYSALRLARDGAATTAARTETPARLERSPREGTTAAPASRSYRSQLHWPSSADEIKRVHTVHDPGLTAVADRRAARLPLAQRIERAFLAPGSRLRRATFSIGDGRGRVHVILHSKGDRVALVALCPPALRGVVARALAQVRFKLAARRITMN